MTSAETTSAGQARWEVRSFLAPKLRIALAILCLVPTPASAQQQPRSGYSDAHVHLNDPDSWIRIMDDLGIARSVALRGRDADNAALREAGQRWPGRILPFVSVSPEHREFRAAWTADDERLVTLVDSLLSQGGYYGIGEISVSHFPAAGFPEADFDPNGRTMRSLVQLARKHRVPILIHCEITRLREFEALLREHRDVTVIWAHGGYTPLFLARRLLEQHPNLIYELSARTWARHPRSPDYTIFRNETSVWPEWLDLIESMPTRFLVGTDASGRSEGTNIANAQRVQLFLDQLSPTTRIHVAHQNLDRVLGLIG
jgi:Tat protein secretion system quality control protein TatD with DNase activity